MKNHRRKVDTIHQRETPRIMLELSLMFTIRLTRDVKIPNKDIIITNAHTRTNGNPNDAGMEVALGLTPVLI